MYGYDTSALMLKTFLLLATHNQTHNDTAVSNTLYHVNIGKGIEGKRCYGPYGCFPISPPWTSEHRPVSLYPEHPEKIKPGFWLYKSLEDERPYVFDLYDGNTVRKSKMNVNLPIYIISHGYLEAGDRLWIKTLRLELLSYHPCSVIVVDWGGGSSPPYTQAVANIRLVGSIMAHLLDMIAKRTEDKKLDHVHVIGHSLGAHLGGYIGYTLQKDFQLTLGRITGLDPAEPHFAKSGRPVRLSPSAAKYVDVIHTDATGFIRGGLGIIERVGHVDFDPNGGTDQPGCTKNMVEHISEEKGSFIRGLRRFLGCNHIRSYEFFTESIRTQCPFKAISCPSFESFKNGSCFDCNDNRCLTFGYHSKESYDLAIKSGIIKPNEEKLTFYLLTSSAPPFCRSHYKVRVKISNATESRVHGGEIGQLWFNVHSEINSKGKGAGEESGRFALNAGRYHEPGALYQAVLPANMVSNMKGVTVEWQYHSSVFNPLTWRLLSAPKIYLNGVTITSLELGKSISVCPKQKNVPLLTHSPQIWLESYC